MYKIPYSGQVKHLGKIVWHLKSWSSWDATKIINGSKQNKNWKERTKANFFTSPIINWGRKKNDIEPSDWKNTNQWTYLVT